MYRFAATLLFLLSLPLGTASAQQGRTSDGALAPMRLRSQLLYGTPRGEGATPTVSLRPLPRLHETAQRDTSFSQRPADPWLAFDKVQHFTFSFLWTLGSQYTFVNKWGLSEEGALPLSITSGAAIGLAKEFYDWRVKPSRYFSRRDLVADGLGIALAVGWVLL